MFQGFPLNVSRFFLKKGVDRGFVVLRKGSGPAPALPGRDLREAVRLPHFLVRICGKRSGSRTSWSGSAGSGPAPALPGQDLREAVRLPHFLVRICGKRSGSRTSWSGSAGSGPAPALPGQDLREAVRLPHFPVRICGKRSGSRTSRSGSAGSALAPALAGTLRPSHVQLFAKQSEVGRMQAKQASGIVAIAAGFLERPFGDGYPGSVQFLVPQVDFDHFGAL